MKQKKGRPIQEADEVFSLNPKTSDEMMVLLPYFNQVDSVQFQKH
jgi:hypothetical protein